MAGDFPTPPSPPAEQTSVLNNHHPTEECSPDAGATLIDKLTIARGYIASAPDLRQPVIALTLSGL